MLIRPSNLAIVSKAVHNGITINSATNAFHYMCSISLVDREKLVGHWISQLIAMLASLIVRIFMRIAIISPYMRDRLAVFRTANAFLPIAGSIVTSD